MSTVSADTSGIALGEPVPNALVEIRDQRMRVIDTVVADAQGAYSWTSPASGTFVVNLLTRDGRTVQRETVTVNSVTVRGFHRAGPTGRLGTVERRHDSAEEATPRPALLSVEAVTDLAAYPVLTEEVSTTGVPAPAGGRIWRRWQRRRRLRPGC